MVSEVSYVGSTSGWHYSSSKTVSEAREPPSRTTRALSVWQTDVRSGKDLRRRFEEWSIRLLHYTTKGRSRNKATTPRECCWHGESPNPFLHSEDDLDLTTAFKDDDGPIMHDEVDLKYSVSSVQGSP